MPDQLTDCPDLFFQKTQTKAILTSGLLLMAISFTQSSQSADQLSTQAMTQQRDFQISAQNLDRALVEYSLKTGLQITVDGNLTAGVKSLGVSGRYSLEQALQKLLAGTGVVVKTSDNKMITLEKLSAVKSQFEITPKTMSPVTVTGNAIYDSTDPYNASYTRSNTTTATKTDTPIMETPMSVKVIPQQVLRDQQAVRIDKALENVSGVYQQPSSLGDISFFSIRGFGGYDGNSSFLYRNGVRASYAGADASFPDMANIERVEVLKGPASILYGRVEPGGMVNLVTKQPLDTPYFSLQQQVGSYDFYRTSADATGPITKNGALAYRLNVAYENKGSFQDFASSNRVFVAPVIRWNISDKTTASLWLDYTKANDSILDTIPALGNRPASIPRSRSFGDPNNGQMQTEEQRFGFNWTHAFSNNWKFRHVFDARRNENNLTPNLGNNGIVDQANCTPQDCPVARYGQAFRGQPRHSEGYFNSLDLTGHFDTLGLKHTLLIGGDYWHTTFNATGNELVTFYNGEISNIDLYNPKYNGIPYSLFQTAPGYNQPNSSQDWAGVYAQDQIKLPYNFHLLGGLRYDNASSSTDALGVASQHDHRVSPRVALLWQPISELSLYSNYVENFGAAGAQSASGGYLPPQTAQQWEVGAKTEVFDGKLTGSLAWFDITKQNVGVPDPNNLGMARLGYMVPIGQVHNQGLEFDVAGEIIAGWKMIGSYAYIQSIITKDSALNGPSDSNGDPTLTTGNTGHHFFGVPTNGASLWNTYDFQNKLMHGLKLGAGVVVRGQQQANNENTVQLPGYALVNLLASYQWKISSSKFTAQLNVDNLLDKTYYAAQGFGGGTAGFAGMPRVFMGSIRIEY